MIAVLISILRQQRQRKTALFQLSGGITSWAAARRYLDLNPKHPFEMIFADTFIEDADTYKFLICGAANLAEVPRPCFWDMPIPEIDLDNPEPRRQVLKALAKSAMQAIPNFHWVWEGRTPWEVFDDCRFIGNSRVDPCSRVLKRDFLDAWLAKRFSPERCIVIVGLNFDEDNRIERIRERGKPWDFLAPLGDQPWSSKTQIIEHAFKLGLPISRAYREGLAHDNCGGGCVKAGQGHFIMLYHVRRDVFDKWKAREKTSQQRIGTNATMLKCRRGGKPKPLSLEQLQARIESGNVREEEKLELGGCACALTV